MRGILSLLCTSQCQEVANLPREYKFMSSVCFNQTQQQGSQQGHQERRAGFPLLSKPISAWTVAQLLCILQLMEINAFLGGCSYKLVRLGGLV